MKHWLLTAFFTSIVLSSSVARYTAACILSAYLSVCLCLSWPHAFQKIINTIYKSKLSGVPKETIAILESGTANGSKINRCKKELPQFAQKMGEKNKDRNNRCCIVLYFNTQRPKFVKTFRIICILITFIQLGYFLNKF